MNKKVWRVLYLARPRRVIFYHGDEAYENRTTYRLTLRQATRLADQLFRVLKNDPNFHLYPNEDGWVMHKLTNETCITIEIKKGMLIDVRGLPPGYTYQLIDWDLCPECGGRGCNLCKQLNK